MQKRKEKETEKNIENHQNKIIIVLFFNNRNNRKKKRYRATRKKNMEILSPYLSIITLNINRLNSPVITQSTQNTKTPKYMLSRKLNSALKVSIDIKGRDGRPYSMQWQPTILI